MSKSELEKYYLDTTYSIFINEKQYDIKIGKLLPYVIKNLLDKEKSAVILTAWNPRSELLSLQENEQRNRKLNSTLKDNNYRVFSALGQGKDLSYKLWPAEKSFLVLGITKEEVEKIAVDYGQYAYVWLEAGKPASLMFSRIWLSLRTE